MDLTKLAASIYLAGAVVLTVGVGLFSVPAALICAGGLMLVTGVWALKETE